MDRMNKLETEYLSDRKILLMLHSQAGPAARYAHFKSKNLDRARKRADEMFHEMIEIAALNNVWGTTAINGIHRAITSSLYRRGTSADVRRAWQRMTRMQGLYINARRLKLIQSRALCESYYVRYKPAIDLKAAQEAAKAEAA
jgi:hypothetical protein